MSKFRVVVLVPFLFSSLTSNAQDMVGKVKHALRESTLNQPGTKPFHLKAALTPSFDRDKDSGRTGEVEIWWASPTTWKREVTCHGFHEIEITNGDRIWQKNEGDFFPEWLREGATELIDPIPFSDTILQSVRNAENRVLVPFANGTENRKLPSQLLVEWITNTGTPEVHNIQRSVISIDPKTGLFFYASGFGWGAEFKDYQSFHDRRVPRTVNWGHPQVTAHITVLEDLEKTPDGFFDTSAPGGVPQPIQTELIDEVTLRKNLLPMEPISWPPLQDGVLQGNVTTNVVVDREGKVREIGTVVSENNAINDAGRDAAMKLRFKPFVTNGTTVQVMSQVTLPFKTARPAGTDVFDSAHNYFENSRRVSFPAWGGRKPYVLKAEFEVLLHGTPTKGRYEDTWLSGGQWRREAWIGDSRYARMKDGDKGYQLIKGDDTQLLRLVFRIMEPIPAIDTFQESDWRIRGDEIDGKRLVRVVSGYESPEGELDAEQGRGYWFDESGLLIKAHFDGLEIQRSDFTNFDDVRVANRVDIRRKGSLAMKIRITALGPAEKAATDLFKEQGKEWQPTFTDEQR